MELTKRLYYAGVVFRYVGDDTEGSRVYQSADGLVKRTILTACCDFDGTLIGMVDEAFRESEADDMVRFFDSVTGEEEKDSYVLEEAAYEN